MKQLLTIACLSMMSFWSCTPDKASKEQKDYIINQPDFEALERKKAGLPPKPKIKKQATNQKDSTQAYLKKMAHDFRLQGKQYKALEYIYEKYISKEEQALANNDTTQLAKLLADKEKQIEVVLGERNYAKKKTFDKNYNNQQISDKLKTVKLSKTDNIYMSALNAKLNLSKENLDALKLSLYEYRKSLVDRSRNEVEIINRTQAKKEKELLGDIIYFRKLAFDKTHNDYQNRKEEISTLKPKTIRIMRTLNFTYEEAKKIETMNTRYKQQLRRTKEEDKASIEQQKKENLLTLLGNYNYERLEHLNNLLSTGAYNISRGNIWLNQADESYLNALNAKLRLSKQQFSDLEMCIYHFKSSTKTANATIGTTQAKVEQTILDKAQYDAKLQFDKTYF